MKLYDWKSKAPFEEHLKAKEAAIISIAKGIHEKCFEIKELYDKFDKSYEDRIYRFYHHSFKVYYLQEFTIEAVKLFKSIDPELNDWFVKIIEQGTNKIWKREDNDNWLETVGPIVEAYLHCMYFLKMMFSYSNIDTKEQVIPSGWAAILELYNVR